MRPAIRHLVAAIVTLALVGSGSALVFAAGNPPGQANKNASASQYLEKPGCGPDGTDGVAGNSGRHTGQPPKAPDRQDCPNPPGQNK